MEVTGSALTEEWPGPQIRLYPTETQFQGDMVDCIRVKPIGAAKIKMTRTPPTPAVPENELDEDSIPF